MKVFVFLIMFIFVNYSTLLAGDVSSHKDIERKVFMGKKRKLLRLSDKGLKIWSKYKTCVESSVNYEELENCKYIVLQDKIGKEKKNFQLEKEELIKLFEKNLLKWRKYKSCVESANNFRELHGCMRFRR